MRRFLLFGFLASLVAGGVVLWFQSDHQSARQLSGTRTVPRSDTSSVSVSTTPGAASHLLAPDALSAAGQHVLQEPGWRPTLAEGGPVSAPAEDQLVQRYRQISDLPNKVGILMVLAYGKRPIAVELLTNAITTEFTGRQFIETEAESFVELLELLGHTAQWSDSAYQFLEQVCEPQYWETHDLPQYQQQAEFRSDLLRFALIGLAASGRGEVLGFLEGLRARSIEDWPLEHRSKVTDAVFRYRMLERLGPKYFSRETFPTGESFMRAFLDWRATPEGTEWSAWSDPNNWPQSIRNR